MSHLQMEMVTSNYITLLRVSFLDDVKTKLMNFVASDNASVQMQELDDRVVNMYKSVRPILQRYRSGKLPKAFKIIPNLRNWEQVMKYFLKVYNSMEFDT